MFSQRNKILFAALAIMGCSYTKIVQSILIEQFSIFLNHAEKRARVDIKVITFFKLFQQLYHFRGFQGISFYFREIFA